MKPGSQGTSLESAGNLSACSSSRSPRAASGPRHPEGGGTGPRRGTRKGGALERGRTRAGLGLREGVHLEEKGGARGARRGGWGRIRGRARSLGPHVQTQEGARESGLLPALQMKCFIYTCLSSPRRWERPTSGGQREGPGEAEGPAGRKES